MSERGLSYKEELLEAECDKRFEDAVKKQVESFWNDPPSVCQAVGEVVNDELGKMLCDLNNNRRDMVEGFVFSGKLRMFVNEYFEELARDTCIRPTPFMLECERVERERDLSKHDYD